MPVTVVCPGCKAKLKAPDNLIGKAVKCPSCAKAILVKGAAPVTAPPPAPAIKKAVKPPPKLVEEDPIDDDILEEEEEIEARPKKRISDDRPVKHGDSDDSERSTASFIHLGTLINLIVAPVGYLVPLFLWMSKRKESEFVDHHGKTWLNFHISMLVLGLGLLFGFGILAAVGYFITWWVMVIFIVLGFLSTFGMSIYMLVMYIVAGMKAKKGEWFEYRVLFRLVK